MSENENDDDSECGQDEEALAECAKSEKKLAKAAAKAAEKERRRAKKAEKKAWKRARPKGEPWISPILCVKDVRAQAEFYEKAFGFEIELVMDGPDGKAVHAMLRNRKGLIMLGAAASAQHLAPPAQSSSVSLYVYTADVDALVARATAAGVKLVSPPADEFWGDRCARLLDPEGHLWMFATHLRKKPENGNGASEEEDATTTTSLEEAPADTAS